jgi:Aspartyl protease
VTSAVPFAYLAHVLTIPVTVGDIATKFIFDTGIGLSLISEALAAKVGCHPDGSTFTGRRMSGQAVTVPLGTLASLRVGASQLRHVPVGIFDMHAMAGLGDVEGFMSLSCFRALPVTVDYRAGLLIFEDEASLARRVGAGTPVAVHVSHDGCSTDLMLGIDLPTGRPISVEVDTGSDTLILNQRLAAESGIDLHGPGIRQVKSSDETGHEFVRYFTALRGDITVSGAPSIRMADPQVMFQEIIYDGLVGDSFLRNFATTYDLASSRMIFASQDSSPAG